MSITSPHLSINLFLKCRQICKYLNLQAGPTLRERRFRKSSLVDLCPVTYFQPKLYNRVVVRIKKEERKIM